MNARCYKAASRGHYEFQRRRVEQTEVDVTTVVKRGSAARFYLTSFFNRAAYPHVREHCIVDSTRSHCKQPVGLGSDELLDRRAALEKHVRERGLASRTRVKGDRARSFMARR